MAKSYGHFKEQAIAYILRNNPHMITDVGAGDGGYSDLLKEAGYNNVIVGIEIYEPYIEKYRLNDKYDLVIIGDISNYGSFVGSVCDVFILGDVLEHITVDKAISLVEKLYNGAQDYIIAVPYLYEQGEHEGNIYETHHQPDLTHELFMERYGKRCELLVKNELVGYYVKKSGK